VSTGAEGAEPERDPERPSSPRSHVRGSTLLVAGRVVALLLGMATQVVIVRALSKADFGAFAYALALAGGAEVLLSLGQGKLLSRFLATYEEQRDYPRMFGAIALAVGTIVATSVAGIVALYAFRDALVGSVVGDGAEVSLVLILVFLSPLQALDQVFVSLFAVFSKPSSCASTCSLPGSGSPWWGSWCWSGPRSAGWRSGTSWPGLPVSCSTWCC
jgi:hypothetical protein